jgi:hypothetical protein
MNMSIDYRTNRLESEVQHCKSEIRAVRELCMAEIRAVENRARELRDYWLSAIMRTLCGIVYVVAFVLIVAALMKAHSN